MKNQVVSVVSYLNSKKIVQFELKPENFFVQLSEDKNSKMQLFYF
jgi:hypothetical protein